MPGPNGPRNDLRGNGANWDNGANAGSRSSNWNNAPSNSNNNIGARGVCDLPVIAPWLLTGTRTEHLIGGQPDGRASANTLHGKGAASRPGRNPSALHFSFVGQRYKNLFPSIIAMDNLRAAFNLTQRGKRNTRAFLRYKEEAEVRLHELHEALAAGTYAPEAPREFVIYEPKARDISALSFADRIAQHALCNIIGPIFERVLMSRCYACRDGYGTHHGVMRVQSEMRRLLAGQGDLYFLKTDFRHYFANIDRAVLWVEIERKISCRRTLELIERFTPRTGVGLPIGNLTSQLWANAYGHVFDRWLVAQGALRWHRYMDDVVVLGGAEWRPMVELLHRAEAFARDEMGLTLSRWMVAHYSRGVNFLGFRIWPTHKLLRRDSVVRARRKLRNFERFGEPAASSRFLASWLGHAGWADSRNLQRSLGLAAQTALS